MKASDLIKILSLYPDAEVTVWSENDLHDADVLISVNLGIASFIIQATR